MDKSLITKPAVYQVLKDYWQEYRKHPWWALISLIVPAIGSILLFLVPPIIIAETVNALASSESVSFNSMFVYAGIFFATTAAGELCYRLGIHFQIKLESTALSNLMNQSFAKLNKRDYSFFANNFVGTLSSKTRSFSRGFEMFTDTLIYRVFINVIKLAFAIVVLWKYSPVLPTLLLMWVAIIVLLAIPLIRSRSVLVTARHDAASRIVGSLSDALTNIFAIKSFAHEDEEEKSFANLVGEHERKYKAAADYHNTRVHAAVSSMYILSNVTGFMAAIFLVQQLGLPPGVMVIVFSYYTQITMVVWELNSTYRNIESSISEAAQFTQMFLEPPAIQDVLGAKELVVEDGTVEFKDVGFKYGKTDDKEELFLENFNLKIQSNERVGLVGPSGGGKTTITKLLLRFLDVHSGSISIDGQDISNVAQRSLRESLGYVPQEPLLFHRSLFENIAYGKKDATLAEVMHAAKLARADEFIDKLPQGYDTMVGERGIKLSGGQRQRIAIARAMLKNAPILILDEATSALDSESEKFIQEGLWELMKDKTALVIAHRLSTIKHLDRILVLEDGKIVQEGTHNELIKQKGLYATLWSHQSGAFIPE
jgi:ATP-binding cassette subfamily B protein